MICIWSVWCHCHPIIYCFIKIQSGSACLVPAYPGCPVKEAIKQVPGSVNYLTYRYDGHCVGEMVQRCSIPLVKSPLVCQEMMRPAVIVLLYLPSEL